MSANDWPCSCGKVFKTLKEVNKHQRACDSALGRHVTHTLCMPSTAEINRIYEREALERRAKMIYEFNKTAPDVEKASPEGFEAAVHLLRLHRHFMFADILERHYGVGK